MLQKGFGLAKILQHGRCQSSPAGSKEVEQLVAYASVKCCGCLADVLQRLHCRAVEYEHFGGLAVVKLLGDACCYEILQFEPKGLLIMRSPPP